MGVLRLVKGFFHRDWPWRKPIGQWYLRDVVFVLLLGYFLLLLFIGVYEAFARL
jgi:hypothetical protein